MKIILLGVSLESDNRGVNALGLGAIDLVLSKHSVSELSVVTIAEENSVRYIDVKVNEKELSVGIFYFTKSDFLIANLMATIGVKSGNLIKKLQTADLVLDVNEGDSYSDIYGLKRFVRHYLDTRICLKLNKRLIFLPQTIGPFSKPILRYLAAGQLKKLEKVYVRDDKAFPFLKKNNISFEKYVDLAVYMSNKPVEYNLPKGEIIGININGLMYLSRYKSLKGQFDAYKNFVNKMIQSFIDLNHTVLLIPHTYNADDPILEDDLSAIIQISNDFNSNKVIYVERNMDAQELKYLISKCSFFVGSRMHSCIAALSSQVPTVGVAYSYKFEGTFANFGMASHVLNMAGIREEEAIVNLDKILSLYHNRSETREILKNYAKSINRPVI